MVCKKKRTLITLSILILIITGAFMFFINNNRVSFEIVSGNSFLHGDPALPKTVKNLVSEYYVLEFGHEYWNDDFKKAFTCEVDDEIYLIITRGTKSSSGYGIDIDRIEKKESGNKLIVYTAFTSPGMITLPSTTLSYVVAKMNLKKEPDKIELKINYEK